MGRLRPSIGQRANPIRWWHSLLVATAILGLVGIISGMVPAVRASRLDPIEALRYE